MRQTTYRPNESNATPMRHMLAHAIASNPPIQTQHRRSNRHFFSSFNPCIAPQKISKLLVETTIYNGSEP
jgi:hypothetical protein